MPTDIPWADEVWNPVSGCEAISTGCDACYAKKMANRLKGRFGYPEKNPFTFTLHPDRLYKPMGWKKPRLVFVDSMSDLFYPFLNDEDYRFLAAVFGVMAQTPRHTYQILTKRPGNAIQFFHWLEGEIDDLKRAPSIPDFCSEQAFRFDNRFYRSAPFWQWPLRNVLILVSTEDQETFNRRVPFLFGIPAVVHGVSMEPMLGPIKAMIPSKYLWDTPLDGKYRNPRGAPEEAKKLDWMIVGCESGAGRRPFKYDWARQIRDTCVKNDIPFYFKQAENPLSGKIVELPDLDGEVWEQYPKKYDRLSRTMMIPE